MKRKQLTMAITGALALSLLALPAVMSASE